MSATQQRDELIRWAARRVAERYPAHQVDLSDTESWRLIACELAECCVPGVALELVRESNGGKG